MATISRAATPPAGARTALRERVARHPVAAFFALAYALSWLAWSVPALGVGGLPGTVGLFAGVFGPAAAAALLTRYTGGSLRAWAARIVRWRVAPRWYLVALGLPVATIGAASAIYALTGRPVDFGLLPGRLAGLIPTFALVALFQGGNEEPGWRGFALPRLEARLASVAAALLLGVVWALWHLPVLAASRETWHGWPPVLATLVNIVALTVIYTWLYNRTGSVLLCILLHAASNTANALLVPLPDAALQGEAYLPFLLASTSVSVAIAAALVAATRGRLGYEAAP